MNTVKKFTTFEALKSCENKTAKYSSKMKKHNDFEKVITEIRSIKIIRGSQSKPKS